MTDAEKQTTVRTSADPNGLWQVEDTIALGETVEAGLDGVSSAEPYGAKMIEQNAIDPRTGRAVNYAGLDFVPGEPIKPEDRPPTKSVIPANQVIHTRYRMDTDYLGPKESKLASEARDLKLKMFQEQVISKYAKELTRYRKACLMVKKATKRQLSKATGTLAKAIEIVRRGPPVTKERIMEEAHQRLYESENI